MKRRDFLKQSVFASAGSMLIPAFLKPFELIAKSNLSGHKNLVIIQLSGGNDGLNTIVPYGNDVYYQLRNTIAISQSEIIKLNAMQGLNPALAPLKEIYDQGWMSIINNVGYPNPNRSHFRSMDIWQSASDSNQFLSTGWIGRYLDSNCQMCKYPYNAIEVDDTLSLTLKGDTKKGIALQNPDKLFRTTNTPFFGKLIEHDKEHLDEDNLGYLYKTMIETYSSAGYIKERTKNYENNFVYPESAFAKKLKTVARFLLSGLDTRVYYVSLSGFDTHVNQIAQQKKLFTQFSEGMNAFVKELNNNKKLDDTLVIAFSEFGRRVAQNASRGTDHGTANVMMLFGGQLKKQGIFNDAPDLNDLDAGDLKYKVDFRDVYATVLNKWLNVDNKLILPDATGTMEFI